MKAIGKSKYSALQNSYDKTTRRIRQVVLFW